MEPQWKYFGMAVWVPSSANRFLVPGSWEDGPRDIGVLSTACLQGHVMDRRKKALTDYRKLRAFFAEEEEHFLEEAGKEEGTPVEETIDPVERFHSLLQAVLELEKKHHSLGLSMLLQVSCLGQEVCQKEGLD